MPNVVFRDTVRRVRVLKSEYSSPALYSPGPGFVATSSFIFTCMSCAVSFWAATGLEPSALRHGTVKLIPSCRVGCGHDSVSSTSTCQTLHARVLCAPVAHEAQHHAHSASTTAYHRTHSACVEAHVHAHSASVPSIHALCCVMHVAARHACLTQQLLGQRHEQPKQSKVRGVSRAHPKQSKVKGVSSASGTRTCVELKAEHAGSASGWWPNVELQLYAPGPGERRCDGAEESLVWSTSPERRAVEPKNC
jgi:hypothetical protein